MVKIMLQYYPLNKKGLLTIVRNIHVLQLQPCFTLPSRQLHTKWSNIKMLTNKIAQGKVCFAVFFLVQCLNCKSAIIRRYIDYLSTDPSRIDLIITVISLITSN